MLHSQIKLSQGDLINWAAFSNDNNPIHFNLDAAKQVNLDSIVAHGKLALLPVKAGVSDLLSADNNGFYNFKAMFRSPVKCESTVKLSIEQKHQRTRFNLMELENNNSCIKGGVSEDELPKLESPILNGVLNASEVKKNTELFTALFPNYCVDWIVVESLLFSQLVENHLDQLLSTYALNKTVDIKSGAADRESNSFVMQTNQETFFAANLVGNDLTANCQSSFELQYQIGNLVYFPSDKNDVCSLDIAISINGEMSMLTRYGFILI